VPVKYEQVVFCGLSEFQLALYRLFISSPEIKALLRGKESQPLKAINVLKKLCNHPELLNLPKDLQGSERLIPEGFGGANATGRDKGRNQTVRCDWGGKFLVLERYTALTHTFVWARLIIFQVPPQYQDSNERQDRLDQQLHADARSV
jgi:DNA repair and recombination protein RAD54 and RAD54-like protein